jgi:fructokinase
VPSVAVLGEALVDVAPDGERPGGSPYNVAIGLARLGLPAAFLGRLATDRYGAALRAHAEASGVDLRHAITAAEPSTLATVHLDAAGSAHYEFRVEGTADFAWTDAELAALPRFDVLHVGSLASWLPPGAAVIDRWLRGRPAALVSYDPNVRPGLQPDARQARADVERMLPSADVVKASADDVSYLYGAERHQDVARRWLARGPRLVVITRGGDGPIAVTARATVERPSPQIGVVDTVGAGDAFTAGLLDAIVRRGMPDDESLGAALDEAALVAAITCTRAGADPPWRSELASWTP